MPPPLQMMVGLCGAELVRPESVGASQGFLGWVAYLGEWAAPVCDGTGLVMS